MTETNTRVPTTADSETQQTVLEDLPEIPDFDDAVDLEDATYLPTLPLQSPEEVEDLKRTLAAIPDPLCTCLQIGKYHCECTEKWMKLPNFLTYGDYVGHSIQYAGLNGLGNIRIHRYHSPLKLRDVSKSLMCYESLRERLEANTFILRTMGAEGLAESISATTDSPESERYGVAQPRNIFALNHICISEMLLALSFTYIPSYGLPDNRAHRKLRNFFAHDFGALRPWPKEVLTLALTEKEKEYKALLKLVLATIEVLGPRISDEELWYKPCRLVRVQITEQPPVLPQTDSQPLWEPEENCLDPVETVPVAQLSRWRHVLQQTRARVPNPLRLCFKSSVVRNAARKLEHWSKNARYQVEGEYDESDIDDQYEQRYHDDEYYHNESQYEAAYQAWADYIPENY